MLGGKCSGFSRYVVHPSVKVESTDDCSWLLTLGNGRQVRFDALRGSAEVETAHYAPRFGQVLNTQCICVKLDDGNAIARLSWD